MLLRFSVKNHLSLRDEATLLLTPSSLTDPETGLITAETFRPGVALPAVMIYGANASGKTNVVSAFQTFRSHVIFSHSGGTPGSGIPHKPFALDPTFLELPSRFEIDFVMSNVRYHYGFETDGKMFSSEWLLSSSSGRSQTLFTRHAAEFVFGRNFKGQNRTISALTRDNSLFISSAAQNGHEEASRVFKYVQAISFGSDISVPGIHASTILGRGEIDQRVIKFLSEIGSGVVAYRKHKMPTEENPFRDELTNLIRKFNPDFKLSEEGIAVQLGHNGKLGVEYFDLDWESAGTRRLLLLLNSICRALDAGSPIVIDELDASLHTGSVEAIVAMFCTPSINTGGAQLIATTHDTNILCSRLLRRDQIWFAEKEDEGNTNLFSLSDVKTRKGDNIEKAYLDGRYGATTSRQLVERLITLL